MNIFIALCYIFSVMIVFSLRNEYIHCIVIYVFYYDCIQREAMNIFIAL